MYRRNNQQVKRSTKMHHDAVSDEICHEHEETVVIVSQRLMEAGKKRSEIK